MGQYRSPCVPADLGRERRRSPGQRKITGSGDCLHPFSSESLHPHTGSPLLSGHIHALPSLLSGAPFLPCTQSQRLEWDGEGEWSPKGRLQPCDSSVKGRLRYPFEKGSCGHGWKQCRSGKGMATRPSFSGGIQRVEINAHRDSRGDQRKRLFRLPRHQAWV